MKLIEARNITVRYGALTILEDVSFTVSENEWLMIAGPNGAGKSTLINAVSQLTPYSGAVELLGRSIASYKPRETARLMGVLSQNHHVGYSFTVAEVVRLGRYAYSKGMLHEKDDSEEGYIERALELTGLSEARDQSVLTLSGGELQRTFLAQILAQDPKLLLLDEPTNHLDLVYQKQIFELIREWLKGEGRAAVSVVHDLSLARSYGTHALLLDHGKTLASGEIRDVLTRDNLEKAYSMNVFAYMRQMAELWKE